MRVLGRYCLCVWQLPVLGPSPAPPLEKDIPAKSCAQNSANKQKHKHKKKKPKIPKFPISKIHDLPLFHLGRHCQEHVPLSHLQTLWSVNRQTASGISAVETCLKGSSDSLRSALLGSFSRLTSSKCRRDTPSAWWIRGRVYEI